MAENQLLLQLKLVQAIKEVGTVKRFLPSEYGMDPDMMEHAIHPGSIVFQEKRRVRRAIEEAGIPHTFMVANCFAGYFLSGLAQLGRFWPPKEDVHIYGDGNAKVVWMVEKDIGTYVINAVDDPRTLNRTIHMRPPKNVFSQLEVVNIWEKLSNKTLKKVYITEKQWLQQIDDNKDHGMEYQSAVSIFYHIFFKGDTMSFSINQDNEASMLYPHIQYTDVESYLSDFVWA
uniref:Pinoresinol lariciresinol reductase 2 n=1 Tax=Kadsura heteroclita TaxID=124781 RepID=A0A7U3W0P3_9MAGN|nr:pinoresinol lariciresinol reductase 2 [Kadsura heteroclita]